MKQVLKKNACRYISAVSQEESFMRKFFILVLLVAFGMFAAGCDSDTKKLKAVTKGEKLAETTIQQTGGSKSSEEITSGSSVVSADEPQSAAPAGQSWGSQTPSKEVAEQIKKVNDFFLENNANAPAKLPLDIEWKSATYHLGALEAFKATGDPEYYEYTLNWAENWGYDINYGQNTSYLDNAAAMLAYTELHSIYSADRKLADSIRNADFTLTKGSLNYSWIDEIYMASSGYQYLADVTGTEAYADLDFSSYKKWRATLFNEDEGLWYRDKKFIYDPSASYISDEATPNVTPNGKPVFWSRGNAWVYVSLARNLRIMDPSDDAYDVYKADFISMSGALAACQRSDGTFNANLGDPDHLGGVEITGTGGFWFGMCTGLELGLLDPEIYLPVVDKIYEGITGLAVASNGRLGYCQPVGSAPAAAKSSDTNMFGVGLYMMGASAYMRICSDYEPPEALMTDSLIVLENQWKNASDPQRQYKLEKGYLTAKDIELAVSSAKTDYPENTASNLFNGVYTWSLKGASWVGGGLKSNPVSADITLKTPVTVNQIAWTTKEARSYKIIISVSSDGENYTSVVDTTQTETPGARLYKRSFDPVKNVKYIRLTVTGIWGNAVDWATINELYIYPA